MSRTITSGSIVFMDTTDNRRLDVHISSLHPTSQLYNANDGTYIPDWTTTNLVLEAQIFLDTQDVTNEADTSIEWYAKSDVTEILVGRGVKYTVSTNVLATSPIITYICRASYQGVGALSQITFTRIDTGRDGSDASAPIILAQYSADGISGWTTSLNTSIHKYLRLSYDSGATWTSPIKIVGEDGKSVSLEGTAYYNGILLKSDIGRAITLYRDETWMETSKITTASNGDSYIVQGYLCVYNSTIESFVCTALIQGEKGVDGESSYLYIRYATDSSGTNMSSNPAGMTYIGSVVTNSSQAPTIPQAYAWRKFVGEDAKSIVLSGSAQVFKVNTDGEVYPSTISVTAQAINTSVRFWTYSINGGVSFTSMIPAGVTVNGTVVTINGKLMDKETLVFRADDNNGHSDIFTVYKAYDGTNGTDGAPGETSSIAFLTNENISFAANAKGEAYGTVITTNVVAYEGTKKVRPTLGTIVTSGLPTGMTITIDQETSALTDSEVVLLLTVANGSTLGPASSTSGTITIPIIYPVSTNLKLSWSKINTGATGAGISSVTVDYGVSSSSAVQPTSWGQALPTVPEGQYLWTRTITDYTDPEIVDTVTYIYAKQGSKGNTGGSGSSVTVSSIQYQAGTSATTAPTGVWSNTIVEADEGEYLWTKTTFSDGKIAYGVAKQGTDGAVGVPGVDAVTFQIYSSEGYALSINTPRVTLQTFAYIGSVEITADATYQWYAYNNGWSAISGATMGYLEISREDVSFSKSYMCKMTFDGVEYTSVATIDDKNDENKVFTTKPSAYTAGDLWIVGADYAPNGIEVGTLLRAEHTNTSYSDSDWITATKYDSKINELKNNLDVYNQYFSFDSAEGLKISARDANGAASKFSTSLTNERLAFNYNNQAVAYIDGTKMNIKEAEIESPLTVTGKYSGSTMLQAPVINIGNFSIIVESNGSLSIVANT